ncbi:PP2C family protein-serine/threonine phosphatase [Streptomyces sp. 142MFCol3.1]|uniref:PP2C family protein-serine/threonine phosphatase n=1 Tax=Streptomyces sp. 142MFCol3.1 TaxID=1172179 RepID=UPI0003FF1BDE|nr:PP2C family protein-serine/threonine phosphatase [Streptomyces sp. 142MFCol3.1]
MTTQTHIATSTTRATAAALAVTFSSVRLRPLIAVGFASAVLLSVTLCGVIVPADVHLVVLLVAVPALTAAADNTRTTVSMTVLACLGVVAVDVDDGLTSSLILPIDFLGLLIVCVLVLVFRRLRDGDHRTLHAVRSVSETAQRALLPPLPCQVAGLDIATAYRSAAAHAHIGGDVYAAERVDGTVRMLIGDVQGNGLAAVDDAAAVIGAFREAAHRDVRLEHVALSLDASVRRRVEQAGQRDSNASERFITALVLEIPDDLYVVHVISCGHPDLMRSHGTKVDLLEVPQPAPPLGLGGDQTAYQINTFGFEPQDTLLLHTDGLLETRDQAGVFYPALDRFALLAKDEPRSLIGHLMSDLTVHAGGEVQDDVAIVAVRRRAAPSMGSAAEDSHHASPAP